MNSDQESKRASTKATHGRWPQTDARAHKRVPLRVPIECRTAAKTAVGTAENISMGGLLVRLQDTFPWDELVKVGFALPGSSDILQIGTRVAHVVPGIFMGLEFVECPVEARQRIEAYIQSALTASSKPS